MRSIGMFGQLLTVMDRHGLRELTFWDKHGFVIIYDIVMMAFIFGMLGLIFSVNNYINKNKIK